LTEQGGQKHLLFGSHMPFSYAGPALVKLAVLPVDEEAREDISSRTAARFFGVDI
jgi:predicted TIM-barrel fold metal-dependent hydrolase